MTKAKSVAQNAAWIIGIKLAQSILSLAVSMLTARYLGPANYGLINYAISLAAFFTPLMQLGLNGILVYEIVNHPEREGETLGTAMLMNLLSGGLCVVGVIAVAAVTAMGEVETIIVCALYSITMLMEALHMIQYWFQARLMSKYTALAMLAAYVVASAYQIYLLVTGKSVYWFAISKALDIAIIDVLLIILYYCCGGQRLSVSGAVGRSMLKRSKYYILANMMVVIFAQTDRIMLKLMIDEAATGYYSAAVACAGLSSFVFTAIIDSMRPGILESRKSNQKTYQKNIITLFSIIVYMSLAQSIMLTIGAPFVVRLLYGDAYEPTINALKIIVWYTVFSYLGAARNVWILAENKQHLLWRVNVGGALTNVALNLFLIPIGGVNGAAVASLITQVFTNVILCALVKEMHPVVAILKSSLDPTHLCDIIGKLLRK